MKKLAVVVGHSKADKGAYSPILKNSEYDWNSDLAKTIASASSPTLEIKVFYRDMGGIPGAYGAGDSWGADAFIELHFNSSHNTTSIGTGILYQTSKSKPLAQELFKELHEVLELQAWPEGSGGVCTPFQASGSQERGKKSLTASKKPSALIEPFFGSNPKDPDIAAAKKADMAAAILKSAVTFFG